jgi:hypothetical protein
LLGNDEPRDRLGVAGDPQDGGLLR